MTCETDYGKQNSGAIRDIPPREPRLEESR